MQNPWLTIPLDDYEGHMALASIGQAQMLANQFERLMVQYSPASVAIIGCAGGNGLERLAPGQVERVVAVDINPGYLEQTRIRYARRLKDLELHCADVQSNTLLFEPVAFMYAALLFEYVDVPRVLAVLRRNCQAEAILATVLQLPHASQASVSASPYTSLSSLATHIKLVGKQFCLQTFRA
jgi:ubiquinone/menaquinone biosynthesis C-methylase UbiE